MSFSTRIENYTNSVTAENQVDALKKGVDYVISVVSSTNPNKLTEFAYEVSLGNLTSAGSDWRNDYNGAHLLSVRRGSKVCRQVNNRLKDDLTDSSSIYYALPNDPTYYEEADGKVYIRPDCVDNTENRGAIYIVATSDGRTIDDANETIKMANWGAVNGISQIFGATDLMFPIRYHELVIMHAAECILMERLIDFRTSIPDGLDAEWADALAKAKKLFDDSANIEGDDAGTGLSVQYWLNDEDEDMVGATINSISSELNRASQYQTKFKADLEKLATDYQWTQGQIQMLSQKKAEWIQLNISGGDLAGVQKEI